MLSYLKVENGKPIPQEVAAEDMKRGVPLEGGAFLADKDKTYDGINAVIDPREKDCDVITQGAIYNKVPTRVGESYATTELTVAGLSVGDALTVVDGKFVKATVAGTYEWVYGGVYDNPFDMTMYVVTRGGGIAVAG